MTIVSKISADELVKQVTDRYADNFFEVRLINAPGITYTPGVTDDSVFLSNEVPDGTGGYFPQVIKFVAGDVGTYNDDGVGLNRKAAVFAHDGSATAINFSHVALVQSGGNATALGSVTVAPSAANDGTYTNLPVSSTTGSGLGITVDLTITNSGATAGDYAVTLVNSGSGYENLDVCTLSDDLLASVGAITGGAGFLNFEVALTSTAANAGQVYSVAKTATTVSLNGGNEAAFYYDIKHFGFYN